MRSLILFSAKKVRESSRRLLQFTSQTKISLFAIISIVLLVLLAGCASTHTESPSISGPPNELTAAETRAGWRLLFDGKTLNGWRSFKKSGLPQEGWIVENGCLHLLPGGKGGDIITLDQFRDFDLRWEWRIAPKANNGIKYFVTEARDAGIGHEYQMVDDTTAPNSKKVTASFYDVLPPEKPNLSKPPGEWNFSRVLVRSKRVEHWLNGVKVLSYKLGSPKVKTAIAASKFKDVPGFGDKIAGHILLTDHHDETWFRSIRIRE